MAAGLMCVCFNDYGDKKALCFQSSVRINFKMQNSNSVNARTYRALCVSKSKVPRSSFWEVSTRCVQR